MEGVWSAEDTTPGDIESALRQLLRERYTQDHHGIPARVLNLVVVVDGDWRGEIENRLARTGRYHPSRTIVCAVEEGRTTIDAVVTLGADNDDEEDDATPIRERVELKVGRRQLEHLATIVDPLVITDVATVVWAPHGHAEAVDSLGALAQVVLLDSVEEPEPREAIARAAALAEQAYVVDLAWLRSTPWRERITASFDPPKYRPELAAISSVTVRHHPSSVAAATLLLGWLSSRLGWQPGSVVGGSGALTSRARGRRGDVTMRLEPAGQDVPGLAGITVETSRGMSLSLDRGEGGLRAVRRTKDGSESAWTLLGASRGEAGILGEGIRQALLRDPTYRPAVRAAGQMLG